MARWSFLFLFAVLFPLPASANDPLVVGTSEFPPMSTALPDGSREGFDIDVMAEVARRIGADVTYRTYAFGDRIPALERGEVDAVISGMTITAERERRVDFSHPYLDTGLSILVDERHATHATGMELLMRWSFWRNYYVQVLYMLAFCMAGGFVLWVTNRGIGAISRRFWHGLGDGMWLTLVTSSTVGYGEITPKGLPGRIGGALVIFHGIPFFSVVVATITALVMVEALNSDVTTLKDLRGKKVATVRDTTSAPHVRAAKVRGTYVANVTEAIALLESGEVEAVVFDAPALQHHALQDEDGDTMVVGDLFERQSYGIALPTDSPRRESINQAILAMRADGTYDRLHAKWFGEDAER